ncbi:cAMP-responsive element-binding protein-like 2 [Choloepus didactylus]|uniref:cAMP-responsive element-binding protein-like 2 n=1 Tax=Choloepus didactylus TaxID=27675 RepID=UPI00189C9175|nr:cAMP-responsive element-binding protein-like 2 [Choloepus didactylus]
MKRYSDTQKLSGGGGGSVVVEERQFGPPPGSSLPFLNWTLIPVIVASVKRAVRGEAGAVNQIPFLPLRRGQARPAEAGEAGGGSAGLTAELIDGKMVGGKVKKPGKRGREPAKIDLKAKLERSQQSARECRARKKLRYQYLEELVLSRERAICAVREELEMYRQWCMAMHQGKTPAEIKSLLAGEEQNKSQQNPSRHTKVGKAEASNSSL